MMQWGWVRGSEVSQGGHHCRTDSESQESSACPSLAQPAQPSGQLPDCQCLHHAGLCGTRFTGLCQLSWGLADTEPQGSRMEGLEMWIPGPWWEYVWTTGHCSPVQRGPDPPTSSAHWRHAFPARRSRGDDGYGGDGDDDGGGHRSTTAVTMIVKMVTLARERRSCDEIVSGLWAGQAHGRSQ